MRALVVYCHPVEGSFCSAMRDAAVRGLSAAGHEVTVIDVAADNFNPVMPFDEWKEYQSLSGAVASPLHAYAQAAREANIMVFVYPTWWSSMPAQLKGWMERVLVPGVGFVMNKNNKVQPGLRNLKRIVVVTTFGSPRAYVAIMNDNGSRVLRRSLRLASPRWVKTNRLAHFKMDKSTDESRRRFLQRIESKMVRL